MFSGMKGERRCVVPVERTFELTRDELQPKAIASETGRRENETVTRKLGEKA